MKKAIVLIGALMLIGNSGVFAQEESKLPSSSDPKVVAAPEVAESTDGTLAEKLAELDGKLEGLNESYLETMGTVKKLSKIKVSGYTQVQVRHADTVATSAYSTGNFAGGSFPVNVQDLIQVRRGRVKVAYDNKLTQAVIQLDCIPKGVSIKDAYLKFKDPWIKSLAIKAGVYDRPFGFEISYSSSGRESPERSRLFQSIFPGERDLGIGLEFSAADNLPVALSYFNFKGGLFTGNGIADEKDDYKDAIGRLGVSIPVNALNLSIDGGFSGYIGKVQSMNDTLYTMSGSSFSSTLGNLNKPVDRQYIGGDVQVYYGDIPVVGGFTVRGEVITGDQPATRSGNVSSSNATVSTAPVYVRPFLGYYGMLIQNIDPLNLQLVGKYDVYDPNADIEGTVVTSAADMMFTTIGGGLVYHWDGNVKFIAYYDLVRNEKIASGIYASDVTDNVFTFRIQYKF
ncbi:MAG: hypothetical protein JXA71_05460 [Chitinispirillaceae bacterium]|nr:hypothetical protein [Chitinispirillaceae bacterium]